MVETTASAPSATTEKDEIIVKAGVGTAVGVVLVALLIAAIVYAYKTLHSKRDDIQVERSAEESSSSPDRAKTNSYVQPPKKDARSPADERKSASPPKERDYKRPVVEEAYASMETLLTHSMTEKDLRELVGLPEQELQARLKSEYEQLPKGQVLPNSTGTLPAHTKKNRFRNIIPFDQFRVVLRTTDDNPDADYINASFCSLNQRQFIAAQGPLDNTIPDFWRMVVQEEVQVIVNLTGIFEGGRNVCARYWPTSETPLQHGKVSVSLVSREQRTHYTQMRFAVTDEYGRTSTVLMLHYEQWPDKDVPDAVPLLILRDRLSKLARPDETVLVHCSAGVGRTGTFIALDTLLDEGSRNGKVDVLLRVNQIRLMRPNTVQTWQQYIFLHRRLLEGLLAGNTRILADEIRETLVSDVFRKQYALLQQLPGINMEDPLHLTGYTVSPELLVTSAAHLSTLVAEESFAAVLLLDDSIPLEGPQKAMRLTSWKGDVPASTGDIPKLVKHLDVRVRQRAGRVLLCCQDGVERCGLVAALIFLWSQLKEDGAVDAFRVVRILHCSRQRFITSLNQYKFLHEAISAMVDMFAPYGNTDRSPNAVA